MRQPGHAIRILSLLSLLLAFHLMLVAQQASPAPVKLTDADNNKSVQFAVGQRIEIRLSANPTTGYSWLLQGFPGCLELANFSYTSQGKSMPGGGGTQTVEFLAWIPKFRVWFSRRHLRKQGDETRCCGQFRPARS